MNQQQVRQRWVEHGIALFSLVLLFVSFINLPMPREATLDTSWVQVLGYAFTQNLQAGVDYIYTHGPLGYFYLKNPSYSADLFYETVAWWCITSGLFALVFLTRWYQLRGWLEKFLYLFLLVVVTTNMAIVSDPLYFLAIVGVTLLIIQPPDFLKSAPKYFAVLGITLLGLAVLSLTKLTFFILAIICVVGVGIVIWQRYSFLIAIASLITFPIMLVGVWTLSGQSLLNLPTFLRYSLQIIGTHNEAMSLESDLKVLGFALGGIGMTSLVVILSCFTQPRQLAKFVSGGIILVGLFLSWKACFTRYLAISTTTFFCFAMIIPFFIERPQHKKRARSMLFSSLLFASVLIALIGAFYTVAPLGYTPTNFIGKWHQRIVNNISTLLLLDKTKAHYDNITTAVSQRYQLPKMKAYVQNATVDMFNPLQKLIFFNEFNYHPRPIFQGHIAYTKYLLEINGNFYANPQKAPQFILFHLTAIDGRLPTLEDSQALNIILRDYQPLFTERGFLLLKRTPRHTEITVSQPLLTKEVNIGEEIDIQRLSDKSLFLSLNIRKSLLGRLSSLLYKLPPLFLEVQTTEGSVFTRRIIGSMSQADFLINPLMLEQTDWLKWYLNEPQKQVATLRVVVKSDLVRHFFQPNITFKLKANQVEPYPIDENVKQDLRAFLAEKKH